MDSQVIEILRTIAENTDKQQRYSYHTEKKLESLLEAFKGLKEDVRKIQNIPKPQIVQPPQGLLPEKNKGLEEELERLKDKLFEKTNSYNALKAESDRKSIELRELREELDKKDEKIEEQDAELKEYKVTSSQEFSARCRMNDLKANCDQYEAAMVKLNQEYQDFLRKFRKEREGLEEFIKEREEFEEFKKQKQNNKN